MHPDRARAGTDMELEGHDHSDTFRVSVSLGRYFSDERALCLMQAHGSRCAGWLARRLRRTFALPAQPALLCRGHLLPPGEPLAMLRPDDALEAIPASAPVADLSRTRSPPSAAAAGEEEELAAAAAGVKRRRSERAEPLPPPSPPPLADSIADSLDEMKRRALDLLEERSQEARVPRRRRRVRRRRNPAPAPEEPELERLGLPEMTPDSSDFAAEVIRNESERQRAPRCVSALCRLSPQPPPIHDDVERT